MGIGMVLLLWAVVCVILAAVGALVLGGSTALFTRGVKRHRRTVILLAALLPFACMGWAGAVFVFQALVNEGLFHRDPGLGDTWHCPLPDGYALLMIDETDHGWIYNPRTQGWGGGVSEAEDSVPGVRKLQLAGQYILGGSDSRSWELRETSSDYIDSYFLLDTRSGKRRNFATYEELHAAALQLGIQPNLEPIDAVYSRYRFTWFEAFAIALLCLPPLVPAWILLRWIVRLRRTRVSAATV
jgi:hypothetical protein